MLARVKKKKCDRQDISVWESHQKKKIRRGNPKKEGEIIKSWREARCSCIDRTNTCRYVSDPSNCISIKQAGPEPCVSALLFPSPLAMDDAISAPQHKKRKLRSDSTDVRVELPDSQPTGPLSDSASWLANHDTNERPRKPLKRQRTQSFLPAANGGAVQVGRTMHRKRSQAWSALPPLRIGTLADQEDIGKVLHSATPGPSSGTLRPRAEYTQPKSALPSMTAIKTVNMPPVGPVINRQTLKELDLAVILSNHQLRTCLSFLKSFFCLLWQ
jgi:hypothetical protein